VSSVVKAETQFVYDIEVEAPHHNFVANGLVVHNCHHYGGCQFREVCSKDPSARKMYLEKDFVQQVWNPLEERE